ncbi:MAG: hypothetical protein ACRD13_10040, partial [Terriglobales bacterium]
MILAMLGLPLVAQTTAPASGKTGQSTQAAISTVSIRNSAVPSKVDFEHVSLFPEFWRVYEPWRTPALNLANPASLDAAARSGTVDLSLRRVIALALADNLDIAVADYVRLFAQADQMRTRGGAAARGIAGAVSTTSLFSGAIGAGGGVGGGSNTGGAGGVTGGGGGLRAMGGGLYDPTVNFYFADEHATTPLNSPVIYGTPVSEDNSAVGAVSFSQGFATGTSISVSGVGAREYANSNEIFFNPEVISNLSIGIGQNLLPGGFNSIANRAFLIVADNNRHVADATFRAKVIQ